jgi:signal transduction histidine kinase
MSISELLGKSKVIQTNSLAFIRSAGGKWFLDTRFLLAVTPMIISLSMLSAGASRQSGFSSSTDAIMYYLGILLANLVAILVCASVVIFSAKSIFTKRESKPLPLWGVIAFSAGVGALKGVSTGFMIWIFQIEPDLVPAITSRYWQTAILGLWLLPALALVAARLEEMQVQRDALVAEKVNSFLRNSASDTSSRVKELLRNFANLANKKLSTRATSIQDSIQSGDYAKKIRSLVAEELRPLSHSIWVQENKKFSSFSLPATARRAIFEFSSAGVLIALTYFLTSVPTVARFTSLGHAFFRCLVAGIVIYLIIRISGIYKAKKYPFAICWFLFITFLSTIAGFYSGEIVFGFLDGFRAVESILATWLWLIQISFMCSFLIDVRRGQKNLESVFSTSYGIASIDKAAKFAQARIQSRDLANFLHGHVQNKLLGIALSLEKSEPTAEELERALQAVDEVLKSIESEFEILNSGNISEGLRNQVRQWQGFVKIQSVINSNVEGLNVRDRIFLLQVIDEAVANSVRHGLSKNISIQVNVVNGRTVIEVADDGIGPRDGKPGLGSSFFESVSAGNWSLEQQPSGGSKLTVNF